MGNISSVSKGFIYITEHGMIELTEINNIYERHELLFWPDNVPLLCADTVPAGLPFEEEPGTEGDGWDLR